MKKRKQLTQEKQISDFFNSVGALIPRCTRPFAGSAIAVDRAFMFALIMSIGGEAAIDFDEVNEWLMTGDINGMEQWIDERDGTMHVRCHFSRET